MEQITPQLQSAPRCEAAVGPLMERCERTGTSKIFGEWYCPEHVNSVAPQQRHPSSARFHELLKAIGDLHDKKSADYGVSTDPLANVRASKDWNMPSWVGAAMRADDKMKRLKAFAANGRLTNESFADSCLDLASYAIIALVLYEEEQSGS